ncbi:MAG: acetyl-CoA carboxylase, carboxyltransferase subunit beta [Leptospirales bacterium]
MGWLTRSRPQGTNEEPANRKPEDAERKVRIPEGLWIKCSLCRQIVYRKEVEKAGKVCPKCNYHFPITVEERISQLSDPDTFKEFGQDIESVDPLEFVDSHRYTDRIKAAQKKTGLTDAIRIGECHISGKPAVLGVFSFGFMGGSMGSVVGEKVVRAAARSMELRIPLVLVTSSGGARMQEGIFSLMQMARTSAAISRLNQEAVPFFSVLSDPTFGGVTASFAMLGDVILAEPRSLIGFAGPRVIEQTIKQQLPEGFQRAEFLLSHGFLDMVVERGRLKETLSHLMCVFSPAGRQCVQVMTETGEGGG